MDKINGQINTIHLERVFRRRPTLRTPWGEYCVCHVSARASPWGCLIQKPPAVSPAITDRMIRGLASIKQKLYAKDRAEYVKYIFSFHPQIPHTESRICAPVVPMGMSKLRESVCIWGNHMPLGTWRPYSYLPSLIPCLPGDSSLCFTSHVTFSGEVCLLSSLTGSNPLL